MMVCWGGDAALEWSDQALRDQPRRTAALRYRASCLGLLGRLDEARRRTFARTDI